MPTRSTDEGLRPRANRTWNPLARALTATGDRWTLMITLALAPGSLRVTQLRTRLPGVSTGVLERYVQQMATLGLLRRTRFKEMPPRVELELTDAGRELLPVAEALARWGLRHMWSAPLEREQVDVDNLLGLLPALFDTHTDLSDGSIDLLVSDADPPVRHRYRVQDGTLRIEDCADGDDDGSRVAATATIEGDRAGWIAALGPAGDCAGLRMTGSKRLARQVHAMLSGQLARGLPQ